MTLMQDSKKFVTYGNVTDLAVGMVIGAASGRTADSLVNDLIMPLISRIVGELDLSSLSVQLAETPAGVSYTLTSLKKTDVPVFTYGNFAIAAVSFLILVFIVFLVVHTITRMIGADLPAASAKTPGDIQPLREVHDSLKNKP